MIRPLTDEITEQLDTQIQRIDNIEITLDEYELKSNIIEQKLDDIEQNQRKNNIRIVGLKQESTDENIPKYVVTFLNEVLKMKIDLFDFANAYRVGHQQTRPRDILV